MQEHLRQNSEQLQRLKETMMMLEEEMLQHYEGDPAHGRLRSLWESVKNLMGEIETDRQDTKGIIDTLMQIDFGVLLERNPDATLQ